MVRLCLYKNNPNVSFSRRVIIFLLDYIVLLFLSMFIFLGVDSIFSNIDNSGLSQINNKTEQCQKNIIKIMESSKLGYGSDNSIHDSSILSDKFIYDIVYDSLNGNVSNNDLYTNKLLEVESLGYYYGVYKINNKDYYNNFDNNEVGYSYVNNLLLSKININTNILYIDKDNVLMNTAYANALDNFLSNGIESTTVDEITINGSQLYSDIYKVYNSLLQSAKEDLIINNKLYLDAFNEFNRSRNDMISFKWLELLSIYSVLCLVYFLIIPLINKNNQTLSMMLFHMSPCNKEGYHVSKMSTIIKYLGESFMYLNVLCIIVIFLYNTNSFIFLQYKIFNIFSIIGVYLLSILYLIVSMFLSSFKSRKFQTLSDMLSNQYVKDIRE